MAPTHYYPGGIQHPPPQASAWYWRASQNGCLPTLQNYGAAPSAAPARPLSQQPAYNESARPPFTSTSNTGGSLPYRGDPIPVDEGPMIPVADPEEAIYGSGLETGCAEPPAESASWHCSRDDDWGWISASYLVGWVRPGPLGVPLLATGAEADPIPGALGQPGTMVLFGNNDLDFDALNGFRAEAGLWLDRHHNWSADVGGFVLFPQDITFAAASDDMGNPILTRPVFNAANGFETAFLTAFPNASSGATMIEAEIDVFGVELNGRCHGRHWRGLETQGLMGFRFLTLDESIRISDRLTPLPAGLFTFLGNPVDAGDTLVDVDSFNTLNRFYGFQFGGQVRWNSKAKTYGSRGKGLFRVILDAYAKVALGLTDQIVKIDGATTLLSGAGAQTAPGGILALPGQNIDESSNPVFGVVPEFGAGIGVDITENIRIKTGYSFLLWNEVVRPGNQIDRRITSGQAPTDQDFGTLPTADRQETNFIDDLFWIHNFYFGVEIHH